MSIIVQTIAKLTVPIMCLLAFLMFIRGHNAPGGGFIAGLTINIAFILWLQAFGPKKTYQLLRIPPTYYLALGLITALIAGLIPLVLQLPFLTGIWPGIVLPTIGKLGTPVLFDLGVFFVVIGMVQTIILKLTQTS